MSHEVDTTLWPPAVAIDILRQRARLLAKIRTFFSQRNVLEVETPVLSHAGNPDPYIESFYCHSRGGGRDDVLFLHTSPEFAMKRLLAGGSGSIYQICKVFRQDEQGSLHNPEFTMLEWYRTGFDHHDLMQEVEALLVHVGLWDKGQVIPRSSYRQLFIDYAGIDPLLAGTEQLLGCIQEHQIVLHHGSEQSPEGQSDLSADDLLSLILTHVIEPSISDKRCLFVYDFPASQASLARVREDEQPVAERFELYMHGVELANGYHELSDHREQQRRFNQQQSERQRKGLRPVPADSLLVEALAAGLPDCAGVALGLDRLFMLASGKTRIQEVMAFPFVRA